MNWLRGLRVEEPGWLGRAAGAARLGLPRGLVLPRDAWERRHRLITALLWAHAAGLAVFGVVMGLGGLHSVGEVLPIALAAAAAGAGRLPRRTRGAMASLGLITASAVLVHFSGGYVEMHFHFFVMLAVIAMYQDWLPYTIAVGYVALHHGLVGALAPAAVYNHADAIANPWKWAAIHAVFVLAASAASIANWRLHEGERARREESEARLLESERQAVRERDEFLSIAAHELRTPVSGIKASAQLVQRMVDRGTIDEERLRAFAGATVTSANRLAELIDELLDVGRIRTGKLALTVAPTDVAALLKRMVAEVCAEIDERYTTVLEVPGEECVIPADAGRLEQVFVNLLDNAVKYSPDGGPINVVLTMEEGTVQLRVRDEGIGLPPNALETIFQPFGRAANATALHLPGMGLGLHICRNIVEQHGGRLWAESGGEGMGTTMVVVLPRGENG